MASAPKRGGRFVGDEHASGALFGILVASGVFTVSFVHVVDISQDELLNPPVAGERVDLTARAQRLAIELFGSPGAGWYSTTCQGAGPDPLAFAPEGVTRLGLAREPCPTDDATGGFNLSHEKIKNLRLAQFEADPSNGAVDYAESRASLDLADRDFHLRLRITLPDAAERLRSGILDALLRPLYVGDYQRADEPASAPPGEGPAPTPTPQPKAPTTCGATPTPEGVHVWAEITNDGTTDVAVHAGFSLALRDGAPNLHKWTPVLAPGTKGKTSVFLPKSHDWSWKDQATVQVSLQDFDGTRLESCDVHLVEDQLMGLSQGVILAARDYSLNEHPAHGSTLPKALIEAYDGQGRRIEDKSHRFSASDQHLGLPLGLLKHRAGAWEVPATISTAQIQVRVADAYGFEVGREEVLLPSGSQGGYTPRAASPVPWVLGPAVLPETTYLDRLVRNFDSAVRVPDFTAPSLPYNAQGDVVPDEKKALNEWLPRLLLDANGTATLATYNVLVVGSNAAHAAFTSEAAKGAIEPWVRAGGLMIVLGSDTSTTQWAQPFLHAGLRMSNANATQVTLPDHPILNVPNKLAHDRYDDLDKGWKLGPDAATMMDVVVANDDAAVLAVTKPGAIGQGKVIMTAWRPYNPSGDASTPFAPNDLTGDEDGIRLLQNLLSSAYDDLNLDYGAPIPDGEAVVSVTRLVSVWHAKLQDHVEVTGSVYVF